MNNVQQWVQHRYMIMKIEAAIVQILYHEERWWDGPDTSQKEVPTKKDHIKRELENNMVHNRGKWPQFNFRAVYQ